MQARRNFKNVARLLLAASAAVYLASAAAAPSSGPAYMVLDASVNGAKTGMLLTVVRESDGRFKAKAGELRALRIKVDPTIGDDTLVSLDTLPGLQANYSEQYQAMDLRVEDPLLTPYVVGLGGMRRPTNLSLIHSTPGVVFNYSLYGVTGERLPSYLSGNFEAVGMTPFGNFTTTALYNSQRGFGFQDDRHTVRLDSTWRYIDPVSVRSYALGDFTSGALNWSSSIRMAGVQIQSAFRQRSDLVTQAMPQFSGSAALPSTLDMFVNNMKVFSGQVPVGPFELQSLPFVSGGEVKMVTTDANGRQVEVTQPYYAAPGLLRPGLSEYSFDIGAPRRNYGITSSDYDSIVAASGAYRYGLTDKLTLEGTMQGTSDGLTQGGIGLTHALGGYGAISLAGSGSNYKSESGTYYKVQLDTQFRGVRAYAGTERTHGDYYDLARVSLRRDALRRNDFNSNNPFERWMDLTARASAIDRAGLSFQPWFDPASSFSLNYNRIVSPVDTLRLLNVSYSRRLTDSVYAYVTAFRDLDNRSNYGVFATLSFSLGGNTRGTLSAERSGGRNSFSQQVTGNTGSGQGTADWMLANREYNEGDAWRSASVGYRGAYADVRAQVDHMNGLSRGTGQLSGSFVAAGGDVFAASRIGEAFAIVREAGPNSEIRQNGARVGESNSRGRALLPQLQPYAETTIEIDPTNLPIGWEPEATQRVVAAAWRQGAIADFGAKPSRGAVIVLHDKSGKPIPAGHSATLDGTDQTALTGLDGEVYMKGLAGNNRIRVDLSTGGQCTVSFPYTTDAETIPRIGPLTCE